jgi:hypothetical protein
MQRLCSTTPVILLSVLLGYQAVAAENGIQISVPPGSEIIGKLSTAHPRLLVSPGGFEALKQRIAATPELESWRQKIRAEANDILKQPPSRYEIPDGLRLLATSRRVMNRIYVLALTCRLDDQKKYADRAWDELSAAASFKDWNPRHFLDTAEMTHAFAIAYDWLYDLWSPEQREGLRKAMIEKGLTPALAVYRGRGGWARAHHNWNQVCNGGIGMGALAVGDLEPELAGEILHSAVESIQLAMKEFAPDGAWNEGPGYWNYATIYNVVFLAGLQTALRTDYDLSQIPGFDQTGFFPIYLTGPTLRTFNYADGGDRLIRAPQMFWLARRFTQPSFAEYERRHASPGPLDLVWYDPGEKDARKTPALDKYFQGCEVAAFRSDWRDPNALFVAFKAGDNKANHSHLDLGSFVLDGLGSRWGVDLGAEDYNLPGYFGGQRWTYYRLRAEGQNTLVINPGTEPDQDPKAVTRIVRFNSSPQKAFAIADLTPAYAKHARKVERGIAMLDRDKVCIQDEVQCPNPAEVWWFMHTAAGLQVSEDGRSATFQQGSARFSARLLSPANARFQAMAAQPLASSPHPEKQNANKDTRKLAVHLEGVTAVKVCVVLGPSAIQGTLSKVPLTNLSDW